MGLAERNFTLDVIVKVADAKLFSETTLHSVKVSSNLDCLVYWFSKSFDGAVAKFSTRDKGNSLELIELSSINKVSLGFLL